jgi:hypothetical protein
MNSKGAEMELLAELASIISILSVIGVIHNYCGKRSKRIRLEKYLKDKKYTNPGKYQHTSLHLMAKLGMTEEEIFRASSDSENIIRKTTTDHNTGLAKDILFEYKDES